MGDEQAQIGIDENSLNPKLELGLQKRAVVFAEELEKIITLHSDGERTTFGRIIDHLMKVVRENGADLDIFDRALEWAREAVKCANRNPRGFFVAKVKEQTGFEGMGMRLKRKGRA